MSTRSDDHTTLNALEALTTLVGASPDAPVPADIWDRLNDGHQMSQEAGATELAAFVWRNAHVLARGGRGALAERALREPAGSPVMLAARELRRRGVFAAPVIRARAGVDASPPFRVRTFEAAPRMLRSIDCDDACRTCAAAGSDGRVYVWSTTKLAAPRVLPEAFPRPIAIAMSPAGTLVVVGDASGLVHVWDMAADTKAGSFQARGGAIGKMLFLDDRTLVIAGAAKCWEVRNIPGGEVLHTHAGQHPLLTAEYNEKAAVRVSVRGGVLLMDPLTAEPLLCVPEENALHIAVSEKSGHALCATLTDVLCLGLPTMTVLWRTRAHSSVQHVGLLDGRHGLSVGGGSLRTWTLDGGATRSVINVAEGTPEVVQRGTTILTSADHGTLHLWRIDCPELVAHPSGHAGAEQSMVATADADLVVTGGSDGTVCVWNSRTGRPEKRVEVHEGVVSAVAASADGSTIASAGWDGFLALTPRRGGAPVRARAHQGWIQAMCIEEDRDLAVTAGTDGKVCFWGLSSAKLLAEHGAPGERACSAAISGSVVAVGYHTGTIRFWDVESRALLRTIRIGGGVVRGIFPAPGGRHILIESTGSLTIWDTLRDGEAGSLGNARFVAWSPEGAHYIATTETGDALSAYRVTDGARTWSLLAEPDDGFLGQGCWIRSSSNLAVAGNRRVHIVDGASGHRLATWHSDGYVCCPVSTRRGEIVISDPRGDVTILSLFAQGASQRQSEEAPDGTNGLPQTKP